VLVRVVAIGIRVAFVEQTELTRQFLGNLSSGMVGRVYLTFRREQAARGSSLLHEQVEVRHAVELFGRLIFLELSAARATNLRVNHCLCVIDFVL